MEKIRASLFNSSDLIGLSSLEGEEDLMELTNEEILTASSVNQSLFDTQGSSALEDYFLEKSVRGWYLIVYFLLDISFASLSLLNDLSLYLKVTSWYLEHEKSSQMFLRAARTQNRCSASHPPSHLKCLIFISARSRSTLRPLATYCILSLPTLGLQRKYLRTSSLR